MIPWLGRFLHTHFEMFSFLRLVGYLSIKSIGAALTAILLTLVATPRFIWYLHNRAFVDQKRGTGLPSASDKAGTPVMGGLVLGGAILVSCLLWCDLTNRFFWCVALVTFAFGLIGYVDDRKKMIGRSGDSGLSERAKLLTQSAAALFLIGVIASPLSPLPVDERATFYLPFLKYPLFESAWLYFPFVFLFVLFVGNSVNITDGLDGLAIVPSVFVVGVLGVFAWILGNRIWSSYLNYPFLAGSGEIAVFGSAFIGAAIGLLWYNAYPAQIFLGDTGSLAIGGSIAAVSVLLKQEALFLVLGGLFIAEAFSSQLQDKVGIQWLGRRIFYRAPLHHHLQHMGLAEPKVVVRLWIVAGILALASLATIKLR